MPDDKREYRLYALPAGEIPSDAEFYFLLPDIDLVYTREPVENAEEVTNPMQIPAPARAWLVETIEEIAARYLKENEKTLLEGTKTFVDRFREELEAERRKTARTVKVKARAKKHGQK